MLSDFLKESFSAILNCVKERSIGIAVPVSEQGSLQLWSHQGERNLAF